MANSSKRQRRLWDTYTFPGFRPQPTVRGVFGDPKARIITLARRAKKRFAGAAGEFIRVGTTGVYGRFAICRAATRASSWRLRSGGCDAAVAARWRVGGQDQARCPLSGRSRIFPVRRGFDPHDRASPQHRLNTGKPFYGSPPRTESAKLLSSYNKTKTSGEDNRRAQGACRFRRHGRGGFRNSRRGGGGRANGSSGHEPRVSDGQRHAQPTDRRDRENPQSPWVPLRGYLRCDAATHAP